MKVYIMATGKSNKEDVEALRTKPEFRKATGNILLAASAIKQILIPEIENRLLSLVVGSSYGELQTTSNFLATLAQTEVARPFLFQSSLHNAISGFLTLHYGIQGPSITVSNRFFTAENALETATTLLETNRSKFVLVVTVDSYVLDFTESFSEIYPKKVSLYDSSTAMLLASDEGLGFLQHKPLAELHSIDIFTNSKVAFENSKYNDSNALELLADDLKSNVKHNNLQLAKPDGTHSVIHWKRVGS